MRFTRRLAKLEHTVRDIPDPREAAKAEAASWRWKLAFDLAKSDSEGKALELALAERAAHEGVGDPDLYRHEQEWAEPLSTEFLFQRFDGRVGELLKQRGLKDIEEWVPTGYGMQELWEARQRKKRIANPLCRNTAG